MSKDDLITLFSWTEKLKREDRLTDLHLARMNGWTEIGFCHPDQEWTGIHPLEHCLEAIPFYTLLPDQSYHCLPEGWSLEYFIDDHGYTTVESIPHPQLQTRSIRTSGVNLPITICSVSVLTHLAVQTKEECHLTKRLKEIDID